MPRLSLRLLIAAVLLLSVAGVQAQDAKSEQEKILGTWTVQSAKEEGNDVADLQKATFTFAKDNRLTLKLSSVLEPIELKYNIVGGSKVIEISPPPLNDKDKNPQRDKDRGIFKIEGDTLTLCIADGPGPDPQAPKDFNVKARYVTTVVLQREKK